MSNENFVLKKNGNLMKKVSEYRELLRNMAALIEAGRQNAVRQVNTVLMATHWFMGRRIVEYEQKGKTRAGYGEALLLELGNDLSSKFGKGFSERNLKLMRQFYLNYPIRQSLIAESKDHQNSLYLKEIGGHFPLSWTHYVCLIRVEEPKKKSVLRDIVYSESLVGKAA